MSLQDDSVKNQLSKEGVIRLEKRLRIWELEDYLKELGARNNDVKQFTNEMYMGCPLTRRSPESLFYIYKMRAIEKELRALKAYDSEDFGPLDYKPSDEKRLSIWELEDYLTDLGTHKNEAHGVSTQPKKSQNRKRNK